jgi:hypothetical protein
VTPEQLKKLAQCLVELDAQLGAVQAQTPRLEVELAKRVLELEAQLAAAPEGDVQTMQRRLAAAEKLVADRDQLLNERNLAHHAAAQVAEERNRLVAKLTQMRDALWRLARGEWTADSPGFKAALTESPPDPRLRFEAFVVRFVDVHDLATRVEAAIRSGSFPLAQLEDVTELLLRLRHLRDAEFVRV